MDETRLERAVWAYENKIGGKFKPDKRFYVKVQINQKRYGQLLRGEKPMYGFEARNLADHLGIEVSELI